MTLNFEQLKAASVRKTIEVQVESLGGSVKLMALSGQRGFAVAKLAPGDDGSDANAMAAFYVELIAASVVDDSGALCLDSKEGRELIASWPFETLIAIGSQAAALNGMGAKKN